MDQLSGLVPCYCMEMTKGATLAFEDTSSRAFASSICAYRVLSKCPLTRVTAIFL